MSKSRGKLLSKERGQYVELVCRTVMSTDNEHVAQILEQTNEYVLSMV